MIYNKSLRGSRVAVVAAEAAFGASEAKDNASTGRNAFRNITRRVEVGAVDPIVGLLSSQDSVSEVGLSNRDLSCDSDAGDRP